jgi:hypothetical protein
MKTVMMAVIVSVVAGSALAERPTLRGNEAPRATDLLRAQKLADQAKERLKLPAKKGGGWARGGSGWGEETKMPERGPVNIHIHSGGSRKSRPAD